MNRAQWLSRALGLLAREGGEKLHIEALCRDLGVTRGSFYWHFRDRDDFVASLVEFWASEFTGRAAELVASVRGTPQRRLLVLMETLFEEGSARYDLVVRAWAAQEPSVARTIAKVDRQRSRVVRELFAEMGFRGVELEMRTATFVVFHSFEDGMSVRQGKAQRRRQLRARHAFLTRP